MARNIGFFSLAPYSGKTTSSAYLAKALALLGKKVGLMSQNNLSNCYSTEGEPLIINNLTIINRNETPSEDFEYFLVDIPRSETDFKDILKNLDEVIIPIEGNFLGLDFLNKTLDELKDHKKLSLRGFLLNQCNKNGTKHQEIRKKLEFYFPGFVFNTEISRDYYLADNDFSIRNLGNSGFHPGFLEYLECANELIEHEC